MYHSGRISDCYQGAAMSAKSGLKKQTGSSDTLEVPDQDLFVSDDPALAKYPKQPDPAMSGKKEMVVNDSVSQNLKAEKLAYIFEMLEELRKLSNTLDEPMIAYLIEMALLETNTAINVGEFDLEMGKRARQQL
jgi:hypothetical protein